MAKKLRNIKLYINDIQTAINRIHDYSSGMDYNSFKVDNKTIDAVISILK